MPQPPIILYVEDDHFVRDAVAGLLKAAGFVIESFSTAEEFLRRGRPDEASCLIFDVKLPGMSGLQLQSHLIASVYHIPTIFVTSHSDEPLRRAALNAGAVCFLSKPVANKELLSCIRTALSPSKND